MFTGEHFEKYDKEECNILTFDSMLVVDFKAGCRCLKVSCCFVECCFQDLFKTAYSILV